MKIHWRALFLLLLFFCLPLGRVYAFDTYVIHPKLAGIIATLFNERYSEYLLNQQGIEWLTQGTIEEDEPISRAFNHFYNPLNKQGLKIAGIKLGLPSPEWGFSSSAQGSSQGGDCAWQTAVKAYVNNDIARGLRCLGHMLHLVEDVGVPAHTRNDQHAFGDPFESWGKYNSPEASLGFDMFEPHCQKADDCIRELAEWVNGNFLSKDTIDNNNFPAPMNRARREGLYLMDGSRKIAAFNPKNNSYYLSQDIQKEYWQEISPKIIAFGLRLLEIFFLEVKALQPEVMAQDNEIVSQPTQETISQSIKPAVLALPNKPKSTEQVKPNEPSKPFPGIKPAETPPKQKQQANTPTLPVITIEPTIVPEIPIQPVLSEPLDTYILTRPASVINEKFAEFVFSSNTTGVAFQCSSNNSNWQSCPSRYRLENLRDGKHTIYVRSVYNNKNDPSPISYSWTVDTTAPITALFSDVGFNKRTVTFRFYSEIGAHFECKLDTAAWSECQSPKQYENLSAGNHFFQVRATDRVGNTEVIASGYTWQIVIDKPNAPVVIFPSSSPFYTNSSSIEIKASTPADSKLLINGSEDNIQRVNDIWVSEQALSDGDNIYSLTSQNIYQEISDANTITVIKDNMTPSAIIENLPENYDQLQFNVAWRGFDSNSENLRYDVDFKLASGDWESWQTMTSEIQAEFTVPFLGPAISFRVRARDQAGNISDWSESATTYYSFSPTTRLVISQVVTNGTQGSLDEFIEIYNPSSAHINLSGYKIQKKSQAGMVWLDSTPLNSLNHLTIPPYGYVLIAGKDYSYATEADIKINTELAYDDNGHLRITDAMVDEIDRLGYGSAINPEGLAAPSPSQSVALQRKAQYSSTAQSLQANPHQGNGYDSNFNLLDFILQNVVVPRASHNQALISGNVEEGLLYLWHFDECNGVTFDSLNLSTSYQIASWAVGKYGCGIYQSWQTDQEINWNLPTSISSGELTLSFYRQEIVGSSASTMWFLNSQRTAGIGTKVSPHGINPLFNNQEILSGISPPPIGTWYHYSIVYSSNYLAIYIDGVLKKKISGDYSLNQILTNVAIDEDNQPYKFDEIAVWNRAISSEEIISTLNRQLSPHALRPPQTSFQARHFWDFDNANNGLDVIGGKIIQNPEIIAGRVGNGLHITWQRQLADTSISTITNKDVSLSYWRKGGASGNGGGAVSLFNQQSGIRFGMGGGYGQSYYYFNNGVDVLGTYIPNDNNWHHIALVYDSYDYEVRYYIDGVLETVRPNVWLWNGLNALAIGEQQYSFIIDDLKIWEGALTNEQVADEAGLVIP